MERPVKGLYTNIVRYVAAKVPRSSAKQEREPISLYWRKVDCGDRETSDRTN